MTMKIVIMDLKTDKTIAEYPFEFIEGNLDDDYFDEAWSIALDEDLVEESSRSNYNIRFADKEEKLEDFTNPPNQHPVPNP